MNIVEIKDKKLLDAFVGSQKASQFLQSWAWGQFQQSLGRKTWHFGVLDGQSLVASALVIKHNLPLGKNYLYCPRGPIVNNKIPVANFQNAFRQIINKIIEVAKQEGSMFMRFEPPLEKTSQPVLKSLLANDYKLVSTQFIQPKDTLILDLLKTEEQLLSEMHPKTRYNIRLAEKKGVKVRIGAREDFEKFWSLNLDTSQRDGFKTHLKDYYQKMLEIFPGDFIKLFLAEYESKVLTANLVIFFGDTATYLHGASSNEHRNLMAPHLVQWRQIQEAKKRGFKYYDFWGIVPGLQATDYKLQSWVGLTRFKKGFGGQEVNYVGTHDLILDSFWYKMYRIGRKFLRG